MCEVNMGGKNYIYDKTKFIWEKDLEKELNLLYRTIRKIIQILYRRLNV